MLVLLPQCGLLSLTFCPFTTSLTEKSTTEQNPGSFSAYAQPPPPRPPLSCITGKKNQLQHHTGSPAQTVASDKGPVSLLPLVSLGCSVLLHLNQTMTTEGRKLMLSWKEAQA